jgi:hypothetical protein
MNLLMVDPTEAGQYRRGKNCVHIIKVFEDVLSGHINPEALNRFLQATTIVNVPNLSVHSMIAGKNRHALAIEPGRKNIYLDTGGGNFVVLTNFPLSDFVGRDYSEVAGCGADRYHICYSMLSGSQHTFNVNLGFSILEKTAQSTGDFPTQFSMLAVPEDNVIHFVIQRNFNERLAFSFADNTIQPGDDFKCRNMRLLDKKGILLSELEQW